MKAQTWTPEEVRERILDAAQRRLDRYGYTKTTMAEIAADCQMSAANLYRYFDGKLDIGAELAERCLGAKLAALRQVVEDRGRSAAERLEAFVLESLRFTYRVWSQQPRINELVQAVSTQRIDTVQRHIRAKQDLLEALLRDGLGHHELQVEDVPAAAEAIRHAMLLFDVPYFMHLYPQEDLERHARNLVRLLLGGLRMGAPVPGETSR